MCCFRTVCCLRGEKNSSPAHKTGSVQVLGDPFKISNEQPACPSPRMITPDDFNLGKQVMQGPLVQPAAVKPDLGLDQDQQCKVDYKSN